MSSDPTITAIAIPEYTIDKVIGSNSLTWTLNDTITTYTLGLNQIPYPSFVRAIYSYDGGVTWNDAAEYSNWSGFDIDPPVIVRAECDPTTGNLYFQVSQTALVNGGNDYDLTIKVAMINSGLSEIETSQVSFSGLNAYTSQDKYLDIVLEGSFTVSSAAPTETAIAHDLNDYPFVEVYEQEELFGDTRLRQLGSSFGNTGSEGDSVRIGNNDIIITTTGRSPTRDIIIYYKIYREF